MVQHGSTMAARCRGEHATRILALCTVQLKLTGLIALREAVDGGPTAWCGIRPRCGRPSSRHFVGNRTPRGMAGMLEVAVMKRILIVEDEPDALELLVSWIQHQRGWEVRSAQSGKSAIELSKTFKPDVVVSDYLLQDDVTGVDVIAEVQSHDAPVRCVLVTGVLRKALLDVQRINGVPILTKPLDFRRLRRIISDPAS